MSWGGARPGAGRKPLPPEQRKERKRLPSARPTKAVAKTESAPADTSYDLHSMARIIEGMQQRGKARERRPEINPFQVPRFPSNALPPKNHQLALDEAVNWASTEWAGGYLDGVAAEGLLFLGYAFLSELAQRPEYRTPVETIATEMTRKWIKISTSASAMNEADKKRQESDSDVEATGETDQEANQQGAKKPVSDKEDTRTEERIKELVDFMDDLKVRDHFATLAEHDGFFGRTHLYLDSGADDEELKTPITAVVQNGNRQLARGKLGKKWLKSLRVIEPVWVYPTTYNATNPLAFDWYNPQIWYVMGKEIHRSRLPTLIGRPVPDLLKPSYAFGGLALSQIMKPYVDIWLTTRQSVGDLIHAFSQMVLMTDLNTILQSPAGVANLMGRAAMFNATRDNAGLMLLNKTTEDLKNVTTPLGGLHELQAQSQEHMLSVSRIPAVKAFGIQPQGLNASSEGEMRAWNDTINAAQNRLFKPTLDYVIDLCQITLWGKKDPNITYEFESLVELTEKERGELRKANAETGKIHIETGVIDPAEERRRIIADTDSQYDGLDPDDVPEPPEPEDGGDGGDPFGNKGTDGDGGAGQDGNDGGTELSVKIAPKKAPAGAQDASMEVTLTTPLLIRLMEYAREDAKTDQDLHVVAEKIIERSDNVLGMADYDAILPAKPASGGAQDVDPFGLDSTWSEADHPRGQPGNAGQFGPGGGKGSGGKEKPASGQASPGKGASKQTLKLPQSGLTPKPSSAHQHEPDDGSAYFKANWHKANTVGGHSQPTAAQIKAYTEAYENQPAAEAATGPLDPKDLKRVGKQMGSNPGGVFEDASGTRFYVKQGKSKEHVANELAAVDLAKLAGVPTLDYRPVKGGAHIASKMEPLDKNRASQLSPQEVAQAQKDFVAHAWLANWDSIGTGGDNIGTVAGVPTSLDLGGALIFRAQGAPKGQAFGPKVGELETMRDAKMSPDAARIYGKMTEADMAKSARKVLAIKDDAIRGVIKERGLPDAVADTLIARKDYLAKRFGGMAGDEAIMAAALDEAPFDESKHKRDADGQFASTGGGGASGEKDEHEEILDKLDAEKALAEGKPSKVFKTKKEHIGYLLTEGTTVAEVLKATGWPAVSMPQQAAALGMKLEKFKKNGQWFYKGVPMTKEELSAAKGQAQMKAAAKEESAKLAAAQKQQKPDINSMMTVGDPIEGAKNKELGIEYQIFKQQNGKFTLSKLDSDSGNAVGVKKDIETVLAAVIEGEEFIKGGKEAPPAPEPPKAAPLPMPSAEELKKAAKATTFPVNTSAPDGVEAIKAFNEKYANKPIDPSNKPALIQKVHDFKAMQAKVAAANAAQAEKQKAEQAEAQKKQAEAAKKAAEELEKKKKAELDEIMADPDSKAAYLEMEHVTHGQGFTDDFIKKATKAFQDSSYNKIAMSGVEKSAIVAYTGSKYRSINSALRQGVMTKDQYAFTKALNHGLSKLPNHKGTVYRKANLTPQQAALYQPGMIVEERAFTSTSKSQGVWSGDYRYEIESLTGKDVQPLSQHKGEQEVLFRAGSRFEVVSVSGTTIKMKEVPIV